MRLNTFIGSRLIFKLILKELTQKVRQFSMNERTTKKVPYQIYPNKKYLNTKLSFKKENITSILLLLIRTVAFIVQVQSINK